MQVITSKDNAKLKAVRSLVRLKKEREKASCFVMEGVRALQALMDGSALPQYTLREIWCSEQAPEVKSAAVPMYQIPHELMEKLSDCRTSQGVLGVVEYHPVPLEIGLERGNYLLLDRLMDPGNMGTLIRSSVAFGFDGVFLYGDCVEVFNPKTVRATMGGLSFTNHWTVSRDDLKQFFDAGYDLISTSLCGGDQLSKACFGSKNIVVIGNEAHGVSEEVERLSSRRVSIPMSDGVESLNAGVAGSICMYEVMNKRRG